MSQCGGGGWRWDRVIIADAQSVAIEGHGGNKWAGVIGEDHLHAKTEDLSW